MILRSVVFRLALAIAVLLPLTASAQSLSASPTTLTVTAAPGATVPSQNVTLRKSGNGRLSWTIGSVASWVRVSPMSGGESATLAVSFNTSTLPAASGAYPLFTITTSKGSSITVSASLTVTTSTEAKPVTKTLQSLVTNGPTSVAARTPVQATATATYSDGSTKTMTTGPLYWTLVPSSTATVSQSGTVTAYGSGSFDLRSEYTEGGVTKYAPVITVTIGSGSTTPNKTLQSLVTNGPTSVARGSSAQATATATFSDGSTSTMTSGPLYWTTVGSSIATVSQTGTVTVYGSGSFDLRSEYTFNGVTKYAPVITVNGGTSATPKTLTSLVTTGPSSLNAGQSAQATATATYSDGSTKAMTTGPLYWTTTGGSIASVSQSGTVTANNSGTFQLLSEYTEGGVTKYAPAFNVTINGTSSTKTLSGLTITGPSSLNIGQTAQATVVASYSDGSTKAMTNSGPRYWTLETTLATVTQTGSVTALVPGTMFLRAEYTEGGVTKTASSLAVSLSGVLSGNVIYVNPSSGNDANVGTASGPVRTLNRAVALANTANLLNDVTISMAAGVYREAVQIFSLATNKSLTLEGAGPSTILTGADDWSSGWTAQGDGSYSRAWPYRWGAKPIPSGWGDYWNWDGNGYLRDRLRRSEMVYVNGTPLTGVLNRSEVANPGTFHVDENAGVIYMRFPSGVFLGAPVEVATRAVPLAINGRHNVTLRNFSVQRNRGAVQDPAVQIANLQNLTVENFEVRWSAYAGLSTAYITGLKIYNSSFVDNGVNGIDGYRNINVLLQDAYVARNNWRGWPSMHKGFDVVQKWSSTRDMTVLRGNFVDNYGHGLWFDGDNQRITVDRAFIARNRMRGAFMELNLGPITIKDSKICENGLEGVAQARTNNLTLSYNQIFDNKYYQITGTGSGVPINITNWQTGQAYQVTGANMTIMNNIIRGKNLAGGDPSTNECYPGPCGWPFWAPDDNIYSYIASTMTSDYNQWYHSGTTNGFRVPPSKGSAVNFSTFRSLMSTAKPNENNSVWGNLTAVSCTP